MRRSVLLKAWQNWHASDKILRFGQYLFYIGMFSGSDPGLFYETNPDVAFDLAMQKINDRIADKT